MVIDNWSMCVGIRQTFYNKTDKVVHLPSIKLLTPHELAFNFPTILKSFITLYYSESDAFIVLFNTIFLIKIQNIYF